MEVEANGQKFQLRPLTWAEWKKVKREELLVVDLPELVVPGAALDALPYPEVLKLGETIRDLTLGTKAERKN